MAVQQVWDPGNEEGIAAIIQNHWSRIIVVVNRILNVHVHHGFEGIQGNLNPKIEDIIFALRFVDYMLKELLESDKLDLDEERTALNARQCIMLLGWLGKALIDKDVDRYNEAIKLLDSQAKI